MKVDEILTLMKGMAEHRIGVMEALGVKLVAAAPDRVLAPSAVSSLRIPEGPAQPMPTNKDAEAAVQAARIEAARITSEARQALNLGALQTRTALARRKAASSVAAPVSTGQAVENIYKESLKSAPRTARAKTSTT